MNISSVLVIELFANHVCFRKDNKHGASFAHLNTIVDNDSDEDDNLPISIQIEKREDDKFPKFEEWWSLYIFWREIDKIRNPPVKRTVDGKIKEIKII